MSQTLGKEKQRIAKKPEKQRFFKNRLFGLEFDIPPLFNV
jgi:hypothetical protein